MGVDSQQKAAPAPDLDPVPTSVLVVDDDPAVARLLERSLLRAGYRVRVCLTAEEALSLLSQAHFDLALCDIKLPGMDGLRLCERLSESHRDLPVILLTGFGDVDLARSAIRIGASDFITKPLDLASLSIVVERNLERKRVERQRVTDQDIRVMTESIEALAAAIDARESATARHSTRVAHFAGLLGRAMKLPDHELRALDLASRVHDVGKIGVPDTILTKPGPLLEEEWAIMREHSATGAAIVRRIRELTYVGDVIRHHHERIDGGGYPDGLRGEGIPLLSRIIAVADAFEVMTSDRSYRRRLPVAAAMKQLHQGSGAQFDRAAVETFTDLQLSGLLTEPA